ncbi:hypothetical 11.7 kDa protein [Fowl aviadenovirus C]|uniref:Hypothetical 11.7 kDa protein n=1 Tax=Fowl aviadenovirus C TaxID=190063 RepID=F2VJH7_9ADEN|nr:hypothetical 11.7 kDa protein [Fowl aviadenovirus C]ADQ39064.1 hypothetical 11.7 kDa protein [Fowl aviadenovirus C]
MEVEIDSSRSEHSDYEDPMPSDAEEQRERSARLSTSRSYGSPTKRKKKLQRDAAYREPLTKTFSSEDEREAESDVRTYRSPQKRKMSTIRGPRGRRRLSA